jgi:hypothetical protein
LAWNSDTILLRDAANTLALRNGTTAQALHIYNTFTSSTINDGATYDFTTLTNVLSMGTIKGSSGTSRNWQILAGGSNTLDFGVTAGGVLTSRESFNVQVGNFSLLNQSYFSSPNSGVWQLGLPDAATATAQTLEAQSVSAGHANTAGATFTIAGSKSNGSGGGDVVLQTTLSSAASGTQNALANALTLKGGTQQANFAGIISPQNSFTPTAGSGAASVAGNDQAFVVTAGTAQTSIAVNFGHTWAAAPVCTISTNSTASVVDIASTSTTVITFGASVALTGSLINVVCMGT